jgi:hypothetical protein
VSAPTGQRAGPQPPAGQRRSAASPKAPPRKSTARKSTRRPSQASRKTKRTGVGQAAAASKGSTRARTNGSGSAAAPTVTGQSYELFDESRSDYECHKPLPAHTVEHDYTFVQFVPLREAGRVATLPRYAVFDDESLAALSPEALANVLSDTSPAKAWSAPVGQKRAELKTLTRVVDPAAFLAKPVVKIDGKQRQVPLDRQAVELLLEGNSADVILRSSNVRVRLEPAAKGASVPVQSVVIDDLASFLASPLIPLTGQKVQMTPTNVAELLLFGSTIVPSKLNGAHVPLRLSRRETNNGAPGVVAADTAPKVIAPGPAPFWIEELLAAAKPPPPLPFVLYVPYRQRWTLLGYTRGELLNSIPLSPQEETTIELFSWDRRTASREESQSSEQETSIDDSRTTKSSTDVVVETARSNQWHWDVSGGFDFIVSVKAGAGEAGSLSSKASKTTNLLAEETARTAQRLKSTRQTKVSETREFGSETRVTRKIRNNNFVKTLTFDFYEVLASHHVDTSLGEDVRLCVLVENLLPGQLDREFLLMHEGTLRRALLEPSLAEGFGASRVLAQWETVCEIECSSACGCSTPALRMPQRPEEEVALRRLVAAHHDLRHTVADVQSRTLDLTTREGRPGWWDALLSWHRFLYVRAMQELAADVWQPLSDFYWGDLSPEGRLRRCEALLRELPPEVSRTLRMSTIASRSSVVTMRALGELAPRASNAYDLARNVGYDDAGVERAFHRLREEFIGYRALIEEKSASVQPVASPQATPPLLIEPAANPNDPTSIKLRDSVREINAMRLAQEQVRLAQEQLRAQSALASTNGHQGGGIEHRTDVFPTEVLSAATVSESALLNHVQLNRSYYRQVVWRSLEASDRAGVLACLGKLLEFVENDVLGFVGDQAALPFRLGANKAIANWFGNLEGGLAAARKEPAQRTVTVPTTGIAIQPRLGRCEAAEEFVLDHRRLDVKQKEAEVDTAEALAEQAWGEADRLQKRLEKQPEALLDDPTPYGDSQPIRVVIENP